MSYINLVNQLNLKGRSMRALCDQFLKQLEAEAPATRKCLERIPVELYEYKPHEKSMKMGYLALIVAEIPRWIHDIVVDAEIDLGKYSHPSPKTPAECVQYFEDNMNLVRKALQDATDESLKAEFHLKSNGATLMTDAKDNSVSSAICHSAHHRGQLTVYMRLNNLPVPSVYGPSADDKGF